MSLYLYNKKVPLSYFSGTFLLDLQLGIDP